MDAEAHSTDSRCGGAPDRSLELDGVELRRMALAALERIAHYVDTLEEQPAWDTHGSAELTRSLVAALPEQGRALEPVLDELFGRLVPMGFNTASPGYLAYVPGGGILHAAVADLIAAAVNRYVGVWVAAPGLARLEADVVRWFCDMLGYPRTAGGFLTTGGSLANFSGVVAARRSRLGERIGRGVLYVSQESHHSLAKAAMLAGLPEANVRRVPSDGLFRLRLDLLREALARDRAAGLQPFLVCGNAGTTNTGAIDDLVGLADLASAEGLWLHVDAAYGGFFMLTERGRAAMRGIERADSVTLDPHKGLFLPYGSGCLLARDVEDLRRAHSVRADYLPAMQEDPEQVDFCEISPELSRGFRGLRVWLPLTLHGAEPFRCNLDEKLDLARWATRELRAIEGIEIVAEPQLTTVAFRLVRPGLDDEALDALNEDLLARINAPRRVFLTSTRLAGRFVIRICVLSFRTHLDRLRECLALVRDSVAQPAR